MKKLPKVTIVIPTYNGQNYVSETIESCLKQSYKNVSIIVINDNSTDKTSDVLEGFTSSVKVISNEVNNGLPRNINSVMLVDDSDFFIYLGHDDLLPEKHVELMISEFDSDTAAVHCNSMIIDADGARHGFARDNSVQFKKTSQLIYQLSLDNFISVIGMMHRTSDFKEISGWDEGYGLYGEWLYYIRLASRGEIKYSDKSNAFYRVHATNITKSLHEDKKKINALHQYKNRCRKLAKASTDFNFLQSLNYWRSYFFSYLRHIFSLILVWFR